MSHFRWRQESRNPNGSKVFRAETLNAGASVYHYLEYPHALSIFSEGRLRLANPRSWSDPYEHRWCETLFDRPGPLREISAYVLCWSRSHSDEPAWRMAGFQRSNPIVRIRCRVADISAAAGTLAAQRAGSFFSGKVCYERESDLLKRARAVKPEAIKEVTRAAASLFFRKRSALRFENEVRTLWLDRETQRPSLFVPIDAKSVIRQVMCSPHAHPDQRARIREEFKVRFGVNVVDSQMMGQSAEI